MYQKPKTGFHFLHAVCYQGAGSQDREKTAGRMTVLTGEERGYGECGPEKWRYEGIPISLGSR